MSNLLVSVEAVRDPRRYLDEIWCTSFADVSRVNRVEIAYARPWQGRLGSIRLEGDNTTHITVNGLLQLQEVPEAILVITIAHELVHYAHGFGSPLPRRYSHPHANNVVMRELDRRGLGEIRRQCEAWIDSQWFVFYEKMRQEGFPGLSMIPELAPR